MGRVKLKIKRLENTNGRQATYAKRKNGIMKKATELSILCDIDIILLMFSPTGKPALSSGKRSIEEVIAKFAQQTPQERAKRKLESLEALRKTFKKLDHDVNIQDFLGASQTIEDLAGQVKLLRTQLSDVHQRLSYWANPDKINNVDHLTQLEDSLRESLNQIRAHKENQQKHPPVPLEFTNQMQDGLHLPFNMSVEQQLQQLQHFSWIPSDSQNMVLHDDPNFVPHRDVECSASSSFASYPGYFGTGRSPEISNSGQENAVLPELSRTEPLRPQLGGQNSYMSYNVNFFNDPRFQPAAEMNLPVNPVDYHVNGNYDPTQHNYWASSSGPCAVSLLDDRLYP
ncbi:agamous-like MADS-box protein AGL30 isoform X2 [Momordica charantia]|uniref:Agamous-like MADS-box protein AGL30 isoform X2 n=1 Tax=Momordica charantia TaxID=3673 RepID=A0A6J1DBP4_MOMCH|nr:agamous-like MADS-box protein AGL30 isoform X2 [Momordica charantia]